MLKKMALTCFIVSGIAYGTGDNYDTNDKNLNFLRVSSQWEAGAHLIYAYEGRNRDPMDSALGLGVRGGYRFLDSWSLVGEYDFWNNVDGGSENGVKYAHTDIHRFILSVTSDVWPEKRHTPYIIGAIGYEYYSKADETTHTNNGITAFGFGYRFKLSNELSLTAEARWRHNYDNSDDDGFLGSVGVNYHFIKEDEEAQELRLREQQR